VGEVESRGEGRGLKQAGCVDSANPGGDLTGLKADLKGKTNREAVEHLTGYFARVLIGRLIRLS